MSDTSLTGIWQGLYSYMGGQHVPFTATLLDAGGSVHGTTHEDGTHIVEGPLSADLSGSRDGRAVAFVKRYDVRDAELAPIAYDGRLSPDGTEIEGRWFIPDFGSGSFLMIRPERKAETASARRAARV